MDSEPTDEPDPYFQPEGCIDDVMGCLGTLALLLAVAAVWFGALWFATGR